MPSALQSMLLPVSPEAQRIETLWWVMFWVTTAVFAGVVITLLAAMRRGRSGDAHPPSERALTRSVAVATGVSFLLLIALLTASVIVDRSVVSAAAPADVQITITGHQWWWQVQYWASDPVRRFETANELHLPVGRTIAIELDSSDVIHSFWVPAVMGKIDLVPGRKNHVRFQIDRAGYWTGQCAEFCGHEHAYMRLAVVGEDAAAFDAWVRAQHAPAPSPSGDLEARGRQLVERSACAFCHTVAGTSAGGHLGPDLTHVAARTLLAAGALHNAPESLDRWLRDPQGVKPGAHMPRVAFSDADYRALVAYLETLK